ncbi:uncharacterized protein DEA37_0008387 [Paragonimus westermani]|uniref:Uncharacterized protein n=1 Tax=Paragonimus westermani TaxID=34504 RepID=A0A5J4N3K4_9TREM|nr:uncharacterized protein DEA37_0008387 [Paragonimus westermani]
MAVLGFQLVITVIGASILSNIITYFTFTCLVYDGLYRFLVPSDELLLEVAGNLRIKNKGRRRRPDAISEPNGYGPSTDVFYFPRTVSIQLQTSPISHHDVGTLPLYSSCQWLLDFTLCALGNYCVTEVVQSYYVPWFGQPLFSHSADKPKSSFLLSAMSVSTRLDLSVFWLSLTVWFTLRTLLSVISIYFRSSAADAAKWDMYPPPTSSTTSNTTGALTAGRS